MALRAQMHDLITALLQLSENCGQRFRGGPLDIMEQHDAAVIAFDFRNRALGKPRGAGDIAVVGNNIDGEGSDPARLKISEEWA